MADLTTNSVPRASAATVIVDSAITDNGTTITLGRQTVGGSATGGGKGAGTVNATGLYINGNPVSAIPTVRTAAGTTDTLLITDHGNAVRYTHADPIAITAPALGAGFTCLLLQIGAGAFTPTGSGGVTVENRQSQLDSAGANAQCSIFYDSATHAIFGGDTA